MSTVSHIGLARSFDHATKHIMNLLAKLSQDNPEESCLLIIGEDKEGSLILFEECGGSDDCGTIGLIELAKTELAEQILSTQKPITISSPTKH